jgi:TolB-like protein
MKRGLAAGAFALAVAGCAPYQLNDGGDAAGLIAANYRAADVLVEIAKPVLDPDKPIIVATVVDIDDLERSSTLGRHVSESVSARFTQKGYRMVEMKFQNSVYMKKAEGELMLTRQIREVASAHRAQAVIVGTYSRAASTVFVNLKVVRPESNIAIAAQDYSVRMTHDVCVMLYRDPKACPDKW